MAPVLRFCYGTGKLYAQTWNAPDINACPFLSVCRFPVEIVRYFLHDAYKVAAALLFQASYLIHFLISAGIGSAI